MQTTCLKPRAVLSKQQVIEIFLLSVVDSSDTKRHTASSVARKFSVNEKTIRDIWSGRTWHQETMPLDPKRRPKLMAKTGRPLGCKDIVPRKIRKVVKPAERQMHQSYVLSLDTVSNLTEMPCKIQEQVHDKKDPREFNISRGNTLVLVQEAVSLKGPSGWERDIFYDVSSETTSEHGNFVSPNFPFQYHFQHPVKCYNQTDANDFLPHHIQSARLNFEHSLSSVVTNQRCIQLPSHLSAATPVLLQKPVLRPVPHASSAAAGLTAPSAPPPASLAASPILPTLQQAMAASLPQPFGAFTPDWSWIAAAPPQARASLLRLAMAAPLSRAAAGPPPFRPPPAQA